MERITCFKTDSGQIFEKASEALIYERVEKLGQFMADKDLKLSLSNIILHWEAIKATVDSVQFTQGSQGPVTFSAWDEIHGTIRHFQVPEVKVRQILNITQGGGPSEVPLPDREVQS